MTVGQPLRFGNYSVDELLGPGGVTETYRARLWGDSDVPGARRFAFKLLRSDRAGDKQGEVTRRFVAAGDRLLSISGPGFVRAQEVCSDAEATFVVRELVPGYDLASLVERGGRTRPDGARGLEPTAITAIGVEVARILSLAHGRTSPLLHRNLTPGNVLVSPAGEVMVVDFGLFASVREMTEHPIERWHFVAPEVMGGGLGTPAADLYSLGAILYFLWVGRPPVLAESVAELTALALAGPPALEGAPHQLRALIRTLLSPDPDSRPPSADDVAAVLAVPLGADRGRAELAKVVAEASAAALGMSEVATVSLQETDSDMEVVVRERLPEQTAELPPAVTPPPPPEPRHPTRARGGVPPVVIPGARAVARRFQLRYWAWVLGALGAVAPPTAGFLWLTRSRAPNQSVVQPLPKTPVRTMEILPGSVPGSEKPLQPAGPPPWARKLPRVANHLQLDTSPPGATVWIDGVERGVTPLNLALGSGGHRIVVVLEGYRTWREVIDTTAGEIINKKLAAVEITPASAFVNVDCKTQGKYPIFVDDDDTGTLCPGQNIPVKPGKHMIGAYVIPDRKIAAVEVDVPPGPKPTIVKLGY